MSEICGMIQTPDQAAGLVHFALHSWAASQLLENTWHSTKFERMNE
jgi:hypothetical protein